MSRFEEDAVPNMQKDISKKESISSSAETGIAQPQDPLLEPSQIEQAKLSDAEASSEKITELETVLGSLPDARAHTAAVIAETEAAKQKERAFSEIALNEKRIASHLEEISDSLSRIDRSIEDDAYSSQSMLMIGRVLEERSNFGEIERQAKLLFENFSSLNGENSTEEKLIAARENQKTIEMLAKKMDDFYQFLSQLQRKTSDYYDGRDNEDEDLLRHLQQQLDIAFESLKKIHTLYQNEEEMLTDYQKTFSTGNKQI